MFLKLAEKAAENGKVFLVTLCGVAILAELVLKVALVCVAVQFIAGVF